MGGSRITQLSNNQGGVTPIFLSFSFMFSVFCFQKKAHFFCGYIKTTCLCLLFSSFHTKINEIYQQLRRPWLSHPFPLTGLSENLLLLYWFPLHYFSSLQNVCCKILVVFHYLKKRIHLFSFRNEHKIYLNFFDFFISLIFIA